ncbi:unnamed protein product [Sphacelaria rigidula]
MDTEGMHAANTAGVGPVRLEATNDKLITVFEDVNMVEFRYPMGALALRGDRVSSPVRGGDFYRLVQHWDTGYCHAFSKPYILQQWVRATPEWNYDPGAEQAAYDFFLQMFHNVRCADYCRRLSLVAVLFRRDKATR